MLPSTQMENDDWQRCKHAAGPTSIFWPIDSILRLQSGLWVPMFQVWFIYGVLPRQSEPTRAEISDDTPLSDRSIVQVRLFQIGNHTLVGCTQFMPPKIRRQL